MGYNVNNNIIITGRNNIMGRNIENILNLNLHVEILRDVTMTVAMRLLLLPTS